MKVIISLTTIPPRFEYLSATVASLKRITKCSEIWVNIPKKYNRFPDWDGVLPWNASDLGVVINRECEDLGPGTSAFGPLGNTDASIIVVVCDDTIYPINLIHSLLECYFRGNRDSAWGLSGFNFNTYFNNEYPRVHGSTVDILEAYGACLYNIKWLIDIEDEFKELLSITWNDDMLISNLLEKKGISRCTLSKPNCNIQHLNQLEYGFREDALHHIAAKDAGTPETSHTKNNIKILSDLEKIDKKYFKYHHPSISYAITVCNESRELYALLSFLIALKDPVDEINVLVDSSKNDTPTLNVLDRFRENVTINNREFDGDFAAHRNYHNSLCKGDWIFVIDADEMPRESFIKSLKGCMNELLCDIIYVPRINIIPGFTMSWLEKLKLKINELGWINWPDMQGRIYRNKSDIFWDNKLHEKVTGSDKVSAVESIPANALWHIKSVERQNNQNDFYNLIIKK